MTYLVYMKRIVLLLSLVLFFLADAQAQRGKQLSPLLNLNSGAYQNKGWLFAPGLTYTIPRAHDDFSYRVDNNEGVLDTLYSGSFDASGKIGAYFGIGRFHFFKRNTFVDYIDYGLAYKMLRGEETFEGMMRQENTLVPTSNTAYFNRHNASLFFNAYKIGQLSDYTWIQGGLGLNADYAVAEKYETTGIRTFLLEEQADPFQFQAHASLGFGYKAERGVLLVASVETPILNFVPLYDGKSTLPMFSSRYRPIIFTLRMMFFSRTKAADCVGSNDNPREADLWGRDMKRGGGKKKKRKRR